MLHFIVGIAGTGKTESIIAKIHAAATSSKCVIYLVPEQYSFEAERAVHRRLGGRLSLKVEVLSFTRAANSVFRAYGGLAGTSLTKTAKYLLMSLAAQEVRDKLDLYGKSCGKTAFLETLVQTCGEFKTAGITCERLEGFVKTCGDTALKRKLGELSVIYSAYQALIERGYTDADDDLIRACELLENNCFFKGYTVFVDGFAAFMAGELEFLGHILSQSADVYFAFTADGVLDESKGMGVFSAAKSAMNRLSRMAGSLGVEVGEPELLAEPYRFLKPELKHIAICFGQPAAPVYNADYSNALAVRAASDIYGELDFVAAEILRLVRDEGCRFNEVAVIARNPEPYSRAIETAFSLHSIPYFMSVREDIENMPLVSCVLAAINAARGGLDSTLTLLFAKSPLLGLDAGDIAALENYCYCWGVRGAQWETDFAGNPRGLAAELTESDIDLLAQINETRKAVSAPLLRLRAAFKEPDGQSFAKGIFALLEETNAAESLARYAETLENPDAFLAESAQLWEHLMETLDVFGAVLNKSKITAARLCELFKLAVATGEIASPPQTLDQVLIGAADRIRPEKLRAVFIIGANENVFPAELKGSGVFSDAERGSLIDAGLEISAPALQKAALEKYFAYFALTLPSEWLFVSFPRSNLKGGELLPSSIISELGLMFPELPKQDGDSLCGVSNAESAFELFSKKYREDSEISASLREFLSGEYAGLLQKMSQAAEKPAHKIADSAAARELFGRFMRLSPSRVERYYKCPFSYFAQDGLGLKPRSRVEFSGLESGSVIHHVLQVMLQKYGGKGLCSISDKEASAEIAGIIREYLAGRIDDVSKLPSRLRYLFGRLSGALLRLLRRLGDEFSQSSFEPAAFELPIKTGGEVEPLRLETADGANVVVEGVVDRVDVMNKGGKRYIRVVDYKSGIKSFALHDVLYGLNMQMLVYLFTIAENGTGKLADAIPAGVLYMPARDRYVTAARGSDAANVQKTREKEWRMSGLLLEDEEALRGMERDIAGIYIPVKLDKSGKLETSSLATYAELGKLAKKVKRQISQMAELLGKGAIEACPIGDGGRITCEYCDYKALCGFEQGDAVRQIAKLDKDEFFKLLEEDEQVATYMD